MEDRLAIALVILFALAIILVVGASFYQPTVEINDASDYVLEDLVGKHPTADSVEIMDWETKTNPEGSEYLRIRAAVTEGLYSPCPVRVHYFYHYPVQNFVTDSPEYITTTQCTVCEGEGCAIAFPEEAIIASHMNEGAEDVHYYASGYKDAVPTASATSTGWQVAWNSDSAKYGHVVDVSKNGEIEKVETIYY